MKISKTQLVEIRKSQAAKNITKRPTVSAIEDMLHEPVKVLDHGFVRIIDYMGNDDAIVQSARVSYGIGTKKVSDDRGLIRYLIRNKHTTPLEMCEIKFHIKLPIFVARQWVRHRTANINEYSARYSVLDREFYVPDAVYLDFINEMTKKDAKSNNIDQLKMFSDQPKPSETGPQSTENKQGRAGALDEEEAKDAVSKIQRMSLNAYKVYIGLLNDQAGNPVSHKKGLARELARIVLPVNFYTQWYWKIDLHNLLHFLRLRLDSHAQYEIRMYAQAIADITKQWVPIAWEAFEDYVQGGMTLSAPALAVVRRMLAGEAVEQAGSGLSPREWRELMAALNG